MSQSGRSEDDRRGAGQPHESLVTGCLLPVVLAAVFGGLLLYGILNLVGLFTGSGAG